MSINFSGMETIFTSANWAMGAVLWLIHPLLLIRADLSPSLHRSEDSSPTEQIEGHLPEQRVNDILSNPGKPGMKCMAMQVA